MGKSGKSIKSENNFDFNAGQEELFRLIQEDNQEGNVIFCEGRAGTGKNFTTIYSCIKKKEGEKRCKLYYTRAVVGVDGEDIGFLPGEVDEKFSQYTYPLMDNLQSIADLGGELYNINNLKTQWEAAPIMFIRGRTFSQSMFVIDECQNLSYMQLKTILTRIGRFSTFILLGDSHQIDDTKQQKLKKQRGYCDFEMVMNFLQNKGIPVVHLTQVRRSGMAGVLNEWFEELEQAELKEKN